MELSRTRVGVAAIALGRNPTWFNHQIHDHLVGQATGGVVRDPGPHSPNRLIFSS